MYFSMLHHVLLLQWITTATIVSVVCLSMGGCWAVIQLYSEPWVKMLAVGAELLVVYISLRFVRYKLSDIQSIYI